MKRYAVHLENIAGTLHADIIVEAKNASHALNKASDVQNTDEPGTLWIVSRIQEIVT